MGNLLSIQNILFTWVNALESIAVATQKSGKVIFWNGFQNILATQGVECCQPDCR
jgi:hypothetical protein